MRVLIVEDEPEMVSALVKSFEIEGMIADGVGTLSQARAIIGNDAYGLILLDRHLPDGEGANLLPLIRKNNSDIPVIFITGKSEISERIKGLDMGADDYLVKPFSFDELMARIRAIRRRPPKISVPKVQIANMTFDFSARDVQIDGMSLALPRRQLLVLEALCTRARRTVLREWMVEKVYGFDEEVQSNSLDSHVSRLRRSLEAAEAKVTIHVIRGIGYLLKESDNDQ